MEHENQSADKKKKRRILLCIILAGVAALLLFVFLPGTPVLQNLEIQDPKVPLGGGNGSAQTEDETAQAGNGSQPIEDEINYGTGDVSEEPEDGEGAGLPSGPSNSGGGSGGQAPANPNDNTPPAPTPAPPGTQPTPQPTDGRPTPTPSPGPTPTPTPTQSPGARSQTLTVAAPESVSKNGGSFTVDIVLGDVPNNLYPAASIVLGFDKQKMELVSIKKGTTQAYHNYSPGGTGPSYFVPLWQCNVSESNKIGNVKAMYLDMSSGKNAYNTNGFVPDTKDVLLRVEFKLTQNATAGDKLVLAVEDFILAADRDKDSLKGGSAGGGLQVTNGTITVK